MRYLIFIILLTGCASENSYTYLCNLSQNKYNVYDGHKLSLSPRGHPDYTCVRQLTGS